MNRIICRLLIIGCVLVTLGAGLTQFPKIKIPLKIPGLDKILKSQPPLTTSIEDAVTEVPFLDDFDPEGAMPMSVLPRTQEGSFILEYPGNYMFECQSYCLRAGTYAPGEGRGGNGYLFAPLKGPQSDIIRNILKRSYLHPEIPQKDIQVLLWAIIARTKIKNMSPEMQYTAAKLLTPQEIFRINGGALGLIPGKLMNKAFEDLPPAVRRAMEAEAKLREMLTEAYASYEELEQIAVLHGEPPFEEGDREVPLGRWSFHPDGYFIRYFPHGYQQMLIELYFPASIQVERDARGRLTSIADQWGNRLETEYDDTINPLSISGEPALKGYAFHSVRFESINLSSENPEEELQREWNEVGWTLVGVPMGGGNLNASPERFYDSKERYQWALNHKREINDLYQGLTTLGRLSGGQSLTQDNTEEIMALGHYAIAVQKALGSSASEQEDGMVNPVELIKMAWQQAVSKYLSTCKGTPIFDPAADPVPGRAASQRGGDSSRETDKGKSCREKYNDCIRKNLPTLNLMYCIDNCYEKYGDEAGEEGKKKGCDVFPLIECLRKAYTKDMEWSCIDQYCAWKEEGKLPPLALPDCLQNCVREYEKTKHKCLKEHLNCQD